MSTVACLLDNSKLFAFLCETLDKFFHVLAGARFHCIIGSHYFPFVNFDQIAEDAVKAEISTPGSFGEMPSKALEPCDSPP